MTSQSTAPLRADVDDDAGLTLVELLVYMFVGALFLGLIGSIFIVALQADAATRERDLATGQLQSISTSLSTTVRDATSVTVEPSGSSATIRAHLPGDRCRAWAFVEVLTTTDDDAAGNDGTHELRVKDYAAFAGGTPPTADATWGVLATRLSRVPSPATPGTAPSDLPFARLDPGAPVQWNIAVPSMDAETTKPVAMIFGSAMPLAKTEGESGRRCW